MQKADGLEYKHVTDYGGNGEVVILLHGFVSSSRYWKKMQPKLSDLGYRVITIDLLGFGKAPKPIDSDYSYDAHLEHINQAVKHFDLTSPFLIMGHSMGALLAIRYSLLYARKVKLLMLLHPPIYMDKEEVRKTLRSTGRFYRALLESNYRNYLWIALRNVGLTGEHRSYSREGSMTNIIEKAEMLYDLKKVKTPTLLLVGTKDRKEYLSNLFDYEPSHKVSLVIENIGHHSARFRPNLVRNLFIEFTSKN